MIIRFKKPQDINIVFNGISGRASDLYILYTVTNLNILKIWNYTIHKGFLTQLLFLICKLELVRVAKYGIL